ncbi:MAG: DUF432 domain-containing protein [Thermoplasmatales archaeon]|nr:DUF432 domain-containing protein [Thermoplasmatales archaeon]
MAINSGRQIKMFGVYGLNLNIEKGGVKIEVSGGGREKNYFRKAGDEVIEKKIYANNGEIIISPVPPVNLPIHASNHLMIEFDKSIFVEPGVEEKIFIKFPVEIGVFLSDEKDIEPLDIFTKTKLKYTLYGRPEDGFVCRWWRSEIYKEIPNVDELYEGIMELKIKNSYSEWTEINKIVFNTLTMKIFYKNHAYCSANLEIIKKSMGKTSFNEKVEGMNEAIDLYLAKSRKLGISLAKEIGREFFMERGFK